jgi:HAD superfamily hydrolase (TIGR01662 family)
MKGIILDLDQTLVDTSISEINRNSRKWDAVYNQIPEFKLYQSIPELLTVIKNNEFKTAIVTNSPKTYAERVLEYFKMEYDLLIGYHDVKLRKPNAEPYLLVMEKLGISPSTCFALGDRAIDIEAAKNAKIVGCACFWGTSEPELLTRSNPNLRFDTPKNAIDFFLNQ